VTNILRLYGRSSAAPAEPGPAVEHTQPIDGSFSWRGAVLTLALLLLTVLAGLGGSALLHRLSGTRPVSDTGHGQKRQPIATGTLRPRSATSVLVLNGNGLAGAAGGVSTRLLTDGYRGAPAADAPLTNYARSIVLYRHGWADEAERLATDAGIHAVAPLDGGLPAAESRYPLVAIVGH
jgi:LytR cell envelope-related transcriptional attenuator